MGLASSAPLWGLAANPALPADLLDVFVARADGELCLVLAGRADLTRAQARALARRGGQETVLRLVRRGLLRADEVDADDPWIALALLQAAHEAQPATAGGTDVDHWVEVLAGHPDPGVREELALGAWTPPAVLARLATDDEVDVVAAVAASDGLTAELAAMLARHPHLAVRRAVAANERTPARVLADLGRDGGRPAPSRCPGCDSSSDPLPGMVCERGGHQGAVAYVEAAVAANLNTPPTTVAVLADHPMPLVRWAMVERTDLPPDAYRRLANDPVVGPRVGLAANPAIGPELMARLAADPVELVRQGLADNPRLPLDLLASIAATTRLGADLVPRVAAASPAELAELAGSPLSALRALAARHPDLPAELVERLAADADAAVLRSIARHPALTEEQLRSIVDRHGRRVVAAVAANPACPPALLQELAGYDPPSRRALRRVAEHPRAGGPALLRCLADDRAGPVAAAHPGLPAETLESLVDSQDEQVAESAAGNPSLPPTAMAALLARLA